MTGGKVLGVNGENPDLFVVEEAVDCLFGGGVVAVPTDTVYGLAVDATNLEAMEKLRALKGREGQKPVAVLIDSERLFRTLVVEMHEKVEDLMDRFWPGALTLVARKRREALRGVSTDDSLGLRMPDDVLTLGLINMLARPVAATSANLPGNPPLRSAQDIARTFGSGVDLILDGGSLGKTSASTVINVKEKPYRILREGDLKRETLQEVLGDLLA